MKKCNAISKISYMLAKQANDSLYNKLINRSEYIVLVDPITNNIYDCPKSAINKIGNLNNHDKR